ncbi:NAD-dependent epimerase/dehydratase family protein [Chitinimonas sp. DQS-5]|uniref:NAD-dependent epimerase/dehydratase family protein n=1 Tax=Parachitinimonas caeni TaxID=3031301 RepID=A0ABT7DV98_9NEIS|nr:NAD-dependent epimerase/dehydratase family protein [Parachitinimonas caeni]
MRRILIVGSGDIAKRAIPWLCRRFKVFALIRSQENAADIRKLGAIPILGDLDRFSSLKRLSGLAEIVLHCAPPSNTSLIDHRTRRLLACLSAGGSLPCRVVYISTSGVYGNCGGALIPETRPTHPESDRAARRVAAEQQLRSWSKHSKAALCILRAPGIYAADRLPLARLAARTPAPIAEQDNYSNHIHAQDLATALCLASFRGRGGRSFNVNDDSKLKMAEWFDLVADAFDQPKPPRMPLTQLREALNPIQWSFIRESRRLDNRRVKKELGLRLAYRTPIDLLKEIQATISSKVDDVHAPTEQ